MDHARLDGVSGHTFPIASGRPFSPSQTTKNTSFTPRLRSSVSTSSRTSRPPTGARPEPQDVLLPARPTPMTA